MSLERGRKEISSTEWPTRFSTTSSNFRCEYLEPWEGRLRVRCYGDSNREGRSWQLQGNEEDGERLLLHPKAFNPHTLHRALSARHCHPEKRLALCELQWKCRKKPQSNPGEESRTRASAAPITKVPLKSIWLKNEGSALCVYVAGSPWGSWRIPRWV